MGNKFVKIGDGYIVNIDRVQYIRTDSNDSTVRFTFGENCATGWISDSDGKIKKLLLQPLQTRQFNVFYNNFSIFSTIGTAVFYMGYTHGPKCIEWLVTEEETTAPTTPASTQENVENEGVLSCLKKKRLNIFCGFLALIPVGIVYHMVNKKVMVNYKIKKLKVNFNKLNNKKWDSIMVIIKDLKT